MVKKMLGLRLISSAEICRMCILTLLISESYKKYHLALETNSVVRFEDYFPQMDTRFDISVFPSGKGLSVYFKDITERLNYIRAIEEQNENLKEISWTRSAALDRYLYTLLNKNFHPREKH